MEGLPDSHGYSTMSDLNCTYSEGKYSIRIGWIEGISMYSGGTVRIRHFALNVGLTRNGVAATFFQGILCFLEITMQ